MNTALYKVKENLSDLGKFKERTTPVSRKLFCIDRNIRNTLQLQLQQLFGYILFGFLKRNNMLGVVLEGIKYGPIDISYFLL